MNTIATSCDISVFSNHSDNHHRHHRFQHNDFMLDDEYIGGRHRRISLDPKMLFVGSESNAFGYLFKQNCAQKKHNPSCIVVNKKKGGNSIYSLKKPKVALSYDDDDDDDQSLDLSSRKLSKGPLPKKALRVRKSSKEVGRQNDTVVLVRFAIDPNTNDVLVNDINRELNSNSIMNGSGSFDNGSFDRLEFSWNGNLDLSFDNLAYDSSSFGGELDFADALEERIEKVPTNLFSTTKRRHCNKARTIKAIGEYDDDTAMAKSEKDGKPIRNKKRQKFQQFCNRKDYRSAFRIAKHAADAFIAQNLNLAEEFYQFYLSSFHADKESTSVEQQQQQPDRSDDFLKRWCESDGRGLEHAILLSYVTSHRTTTTESIINNEVDAILLTKINDARRYEQVPSLSIGMAQQFAAMDAKIVL